MNEEKTKVIIPKELHKDMLKFFLKTSIPRIKSAREKENTAGSAPIKNKKH